MRHVHAATGRRQNPIDVHVKRSIDAAPACHKRIRRMLSMMKRNAYPADDRRGVGSAASLGNAPAGRCRGGAPDA
jgi:hypothetical protein